MKQDGSMVEAGCKESQWNLKEARREPDRSRLMSRLDNNSVSPPRKQPPLKASGKQGRALKTPESSAEESMLARMEALSPSGAAPAARPAQQPSKQCANNNSASPPRKRQPVKDSGKQDPISSAEESMLARMEALSPKK